MWRTTLELLLELYINYDNAGDSLVLISGTNMWGCSVLTAGWFCSTEAAPRRNRKHHAGWQYNTLVQDKSRDPSRSMCGVRVRFTSISIGEADRVRIQFVLYSAPSYLLQHILLCRAPQKAVQIMESHGHDVEALHEYWNNSFINILLD